MPITISDIYLEQFDRTTRIDSLRTTYFEAMPQICIERPRLITKYCRNNNYFGKDHISILDKAKMYRYVLENREAIVHHDHCYQFAGVGQAMHRLDLMNGPESDSLFAGSTTSKYKGVILYPEFLAQSIWPELTSISSREDNPYHLSREDAEALNTGIFPYWMDDTILEICRARYPEQSSSLKLMQFLVFFLGSKSNCISHTIPDFSKAIRLGLREIINEAKEKIALARDLEEREFYCAVVEVLKGVIAYARNLADKAEVMARYEIDPGKRKALLEIVDIYRRIPELPARTFREGLTTVWICWIAAHLENPNIGLSLGRLDQPSLNELLQRDLQHSSKIEETIEKAIELVCCLWLKIGDHVPMMPVAGEQLFGGTGSNQAITIGGVMPVNGQPVDAVTDLTYIMLRATELMMLRDPNLNARYYPGVNSEDYLKRLCDANIKTKATPALHNDKAVIKALMHAGDTFEQAADYGIVGCVEPVSNARSYTASASILLNLPSILELSLFNGRHRHTGLDHVISLETGDCGGFENFDEFKNAFKRQLEWMAEQSTGLNNQLGRVHQAYYPTPMLSSFFNGPMEHGKDLIRGGADINGSGVTIIGLADTADSLSAIEQVVFNQKQATFPELIEALKQDFDGDGVLHQQLLNAPKYGNEDDLAEKNVKWLMESIHDSFSTIENYRGGKYRVGYWTMTNHAGFGRLIGATPNGRKAHENFSSGITPVSGCAPVLTKALNSVADLPAKCVTSGMALNLKYTPELDKETMLDNFTAAAAAYFDDKSGTRDGGMEIQFNVTDRDTFIEAFHHPERYQELLVRVSGYTAYFKDLTPRMQKEIIDRNEYDLEKNAALAYEDFPLKKEPQPPNLDWLTKIPGAMFFGDKLLELLLHAMKWALVFLPSCREGLEHFNGKYVFQSKDGQIASSAIFKDGRMKVHDSALDKYDVRVVFRDEKALLGFLLSNGQDILDSILENSVEVDGNFNYIYRFGYLAKEIRHQFTGR